MHSSPLQYLIDVSLAAVLALALLVVYLVDRPGAPPEERNDLEVRVLTKDSLKPAAPARRLRLAVTEPFSPLNPATNLKDPPWDDMGKLLRELGEGYAFTEVKIRDLVGNPAKIYEYDVLFLTCGPGGVELKDTLFQFVTKGGILYASDWRYDVIAEAFPDFVDRNRRGEGIDGPVMAEVIDPGLRDVVGPTLPLHFDLSRWKTAAFGGNRVTVLAQGNYRKMQNLKDIVGVPASAPLLVRFSIGKGTVIFTSFHNEKQNSDVEKKLLQYLVFSLVTAQVEAELASTISEGGFAPQKSNLLSTPSQKQEVTKTYHSKKAGPLRFALGFRNEEGAQLSLKIQSPEGKSYTWKGSSSVVLEVPNASAGEWTYTVTALELPYPNFPFSVTVSEKK